MDIMNTMRKDFQIMVFKLKLKRLYGKDKASLEELLSNRAGQNVLPYEIAVNEDVDWESVKDEIKEYYDKACMIYNAYSYLINRRKPLPVVKGKLQDIDVRRVFEVLRSIEE